MWISLIIAFLILVVIIIGARIGFFYYLKPRHEMNWYVNTLQTLGYKVVAIPFQPFKIPLASIHQFNQKEYKDAFYEEKNSWPSHDIVVTNTNNMVTLILLSPRMLMSFFSPEKNHIFVKKTSNKIGFNILFKDSLILNESKHWKQKRKTFTSIMNHDFIKRKTPEIIKIASSFIDKILS